ncbi:MAG TPA: hypothetical protein VD926_05505, partial [Acidimicrobiales bacterium]|nr:hypothetical protein [Acidimicrobiales bacterium]
MSRWFGGPTPGAGRIPWRHRLEHEDQLKAAASKIAKQEASDEAGVDAIVVDGKRLQGDVKLEAGRNIRLVPGPSGVTIEAKHTDQSVEPGGGGDSSQSGSGSGVPVGTVVNYVGAMNGDGSIPGYPGWYLANGANGTWDLITDNPFVRFGTPASAVRAGLSGNLATLPAHVHS